MYIRNHFLGLFRQTFLLTLLAQLQYFSPDCRQFNRFLLQFVEHRERSFLAESGVKLFHHMVVIHANGTD